MNLLNKLTQQINTDELPISPLCVCGFVCVNGVVVKQINSVNGAQRGKQQKSNMQNKINK